MRKTLRASVLTLALCAPAFAGDIPCPSVVAPPQPTITEEGQAAGDDLTAAVLNLIQDVLALL
jgi:hypothetical protein